MPAIGYVRRTETGFEGQLKTLSIQAAISIVRNTAKSADGQPDYKSSRSAPRGSAPPAPRAPSTSRSAW